MSLIGTLIIIYILLVDSSTSVVPAGVRRWVMFVDRYGTNSTDIVHVKEIDQKERSRESSRDVMHDRVVM